MIIVKDVGLEVWNDRQKTSEVNRDMKKSGSYNADETCASSKLKNSSGIFS